MGAESDIWSMGVMLFAMVAGFLPFEGKNPAIVSKKISNRLFRFADYFSDGLFVILGGKRKSMMSKRSRGLSLMSERLEETDNWI